MSLFDQPSTILRLIQEAEQFKVSPDQEMEMPDANGTGVGDVATELTATNPPSVAPQGSTSPMMQIPGMPAPTTPSSTLTKTVVNGQIISAQLSQLKSVLTNTEKDFLKGDVDTDKASAILSTLLTAMSNSAEALTQFISGATASAPSAETSDVLPVAEPELPAKPSFVPPDTSNDQAPTPVPDGEI